MSVALPVSDPVRQTWTTPRWLFDWLSERFGPFGLDAYADESNALCERWNSEDDPESCAWESFDAVFANPPFRLATQASLRAVYALASAGTRSCVIVPAGVNSKRWHEVASQCLTLLPTPRIQFDPPPGVAKSSSSQDIAILLFGYGAGMARVDFSGVQR